MQENRSSGMAPSGMAHESCPFDLNQRVEPARIVPMKILAQKTANRIYDAIFARIHGCQLMFNACWEDPRLDRQLLQLNRQSRVLMVTSAGCNTLDYLLDDPAEIHAVDVNPRQNALLHLKRR